MSILTTEEQAVIEVVAEFVDREVKPVVQDMEQMSLAGAMGGHTVVAKLILAFGTQEQKVRSISSSGAGFRGARLTVDGGIDIGDLRAGPSGGTRTLRSGRPAHTYHCLLGHPARWRAIDRPRSVVRAGGVNGRA